ncbi:ligand-binding sensor domain-containing protein [Streptobacillus canis]|uniref:hypothetical protein n=1 Tax=Streptobacillus canis TaxID=2678686 RepID=UPI0012E2C6DB|nr:hypothetical protein [Streptobacillus canis]
MENNKLSIFPYDINKDDTHFVFFETDEFTIWVSLFIEGEFEKIYLVTLIEDLVFKFSENPNYSAKYIKKLIKETLRDFDDLKIEKDKENTSIYLSVLLTDYSNLIYVYMKDYNLKIIRSDEIFFKNEIITNEDVFASTEIFPLKENDEINVLINDIILTKVLINKINTKTKFKTNNIFLQYLFIFSILFIISYFILISMFVNKIYENIENEIKMININKDFNYENNNKIFINIEILLKRLDKKYLFLTRNNITKKEQYINKINIAKKNNEILKKVFEIKELSKILIKNREFLNAKNEYIKIKSKIEEVDNELLEYIEKDIREIDRLVIIQNDELFLTDDDLIKNIKIVDKLIGEYEKSYFDINILDLNEIKSKNQNRINEIKKVLDERNSKLDELIKNDILNAKVELEELIEGYSKLSLNLERESLEKRKIEIDEKIEYLKSEMNELFEKHKKYYDNKEYITSVSYLEKSLYFANLLNNQNKIKEIEGRIRLIYKQKKKDDDENKKIKPVNKEKLEFEIRKSIKLSIEKGDDYLKNNDFEKAYIEYKRALDSMPKVNYSKTTQNEVNKKIEYIKRKMGKKWWELWK